MALNIEQRVPIRMVKSFSNSGVSSAPAAPFNAADTSSVLLDELRASVQHIGVETFVEWFESASKSKKRDLEKHVELLKKLVEAPEVLPLYSIQCVFGMLFVSVLLVLPRCSLLRLTRRRDVFNSGQAADVHFLRENYQKENLR